MINQSGINNLGIVLKNEINKICDKPLILDFGVIQGDYSLKTNTFPIAIPVDDYSVCETIKKIPAKPNDRVLVAWVGVDAVVIDIILNAKEVFVNA